MTWLVLALLLAISLLIAIVPVTMRVSVRGRGDGEGRWSAAAGVEFGPASVTGVRARGVPARLSVHFWGRQLISRAPGQKRKPTRKSERKSKPTRDARPLSERLAAWTPRSTDLALVKHVLRWTRYDHVLGRFEYALDDVVLAGRIYAALTVAGALTPPGVRLSHACDWMGPERLDGELSGQWKVWPVPLLVTGLWWWVTRSMRPTRPTRPAVERLTD